MATLLVREGRLIIRPDNNTERSHALLMPGTNWSKRRTEVTMPLNLLSWHQVRESFPPHRHSYDKSILGWRAREEEITKYGSMVNSEELQVWDLPDLWESQAQAIARIVNYGSVGLFDDRGMGKTRVVIEAIRRAKHTKAVVVSAKRLRANWLSATALWWAEGKACAPLGATWSAAAAQVGSAPITVLTYESLLNDGVRSAVEALNPEWLVVDEAHNLKKRQRKNQRHNSPDSWSKSGALRSLPGKYRIALTGSPMPNRWYEVWPLLNFIAPDVFTSFWHFVEVLGEVRQSYWGGKDISPNVVRKDIWHELFDRWIIHRDRPQHGKVWDFVPVELSAKERKAYDQMLSEWRAEMEGQVLDAPNQLARLVRLQQLAGGLGVWETKQAEDGRVVSTYRHADPSSKTDVLLDMLQGLHRAVVFTKFRDRAEYVARRISQAGFAEPLLITGATTEAATSSALARFADLQQGPFVAVCVYGTISEGVNELVSASDIFFLDWSTVKDVTQAADRLDRPGQERMVRCVTLYAARTVDEAAIDREAGKVIPLRELLRSPDAWAFLKSRNSPKKQPG